jgi:hypothetical protein
MTKINGAQWDGLECEAVKGTAIVGIAAKPTYWYAGIVGQRVSVVRVTCLRTWRPDGTPGDLPADMPPTFFLFNGDGSGEAKVRGGGHWRLGHKSVAVDDPTTFVADGGDR